MTDPFSTPLAGAAFAVLDVETTGLKAREGDRICEIAALRLEGGEAVRHIATLVNPGRPIPAAATAIHGIRDADVADAPAMGAVFSNFIALAENAALAAYNLPFDLSFLATAAAAARLAPFPHATVDVLPLARRLVPGLSSYRLEAVASTLGVTNPSSHRALGDAAVTSQLLLAFVAAGERDGYARTVGDLVLFSRYLEKTDTLPGTLLALEWAAAGGNVVRIEYAGSTGATNRLVTPLKVQARDGVGYLTAHCHQRGARREFRLDRVTSVAAAD